LNRPPVPVHSTDRDGTIDRSRDGHAVVRDGSDGLSLLVGSCEATCSDKDAYLSLGLPDAPYWSKVKRRTKPDPRIKKLTDLPIATQREYVRRWGRQIGLRVIDEDRQQRMIAEVLHVAAAAMREFTG
jgi:hypothetical protein